MKTLSRILALSVVVSALAGGYSSLSAAPLAVGNSVKFLDGPGTTGGGEFTLVTDTDSFITFCLQRTEYIDFSNPFTIDGINTYATSDPTANGGDSLGRDYLSSQTAYLYTQFRGGTLNGYNYAGPNRAQSADALQNAIWMFENELDMNASNPFVILANTAIKDGLWSGLGSVAVLNLSLNGTESQDQLYLGPDTRNVEAVPEPASLILLGTGLTGAALSRRRAQQKKQAELKANA